MKNSMRFPPFISSAPELRRRLSRSVPAVQAPKEMGQFPWITCVRTSVGATDAVATGGTYVRFVRQNAQEPAFYNNTDKTIYVDEMRVAATDTTFDTPEFENEPCVYSNLFLGGEVVTPHGVYVDQYPPLGYLCNVTNRFLRFPQLNGAYKLPVPYKLDMKNPMRLRVRQSYQSTDVGDLTVWFSLFGTGEDGFPIYLIKKLDVPEKTTFAPPYYYDVVFDENRDRALRNATITHVGFGFGELNQDDVYTPSVAPQVVLSLLELQFRPLGGPLWMREDDWIPLWMLQDQPGMMWSISSNFLNSDYSHMIHRFESPVVLKPKQEITVSLKVLDDVPANPLNQQAGFYGENTPIWCAFYGRQEAEV